MKDEVRRRIQPHSPFGRDGGTSQLWCPVLHWGEAGRGLWRRPSQIPSYSSFNHEAVAVSHTFYFSWHWQVFCPFLSAFFQRCEWQAQPCPQRGWGGTHHVHPGAAPASPQRVSQPPSSAWASAANKFHPLPQQNANFIMVIKATTRHTPCTAPLMTSVPKKPPHTTKETAPSTTPPGWAISTLSTVPSSPSPQKSPLLIQGMVGLSFASYFTGHCFNFKFP